MLLHLLCPRLLLLLALLPPAEVTHPPSYPPRPSAENTMTYDAAIQKALGSKAKLDVLDPSPSPSLPSTEADGKLETAEKGVRTEGVPGESAHGGL